MKRVVMATTTNLQQGKRDSLVSQPDRKQMGSPNISAKNLSQLPSPQPPQPPQPPQQYTSMNFEPTRYIISEPQLQQRINELESMYEAQIATLGSSLQEKQRHNADLIQRMRVLQAEKLHLQKKLVKVMKEHSVCNSVEQSELQKENMLLRNFIEQHIKQRMKDKERKSRKDLRQKYTDTDVSGRRGRDQSEECERQ